MSFLKRFFDAKFWRFVLVGLANTLVGMLIMFGLYNLAGLSYWLSSAANYIFASILSYFLNKHFTFRNQERGWRPVLRFAINICVCWALAYGAARPLAYAALLRLLPDSTISRQENMAMLLGQGLFIMLNYVGQRFFAFREQA